MPSAEFRRSDRIELRATAQEKSILARAVAPMSDRDTYSSCPT